MKKVIPISQPQSKASSPRKFMESNTFDLKKDLS